MLIQQRMTMATMRFMCVYLARSTNLQRIGLDLPIYSLSSNFIVHKPSNFFPSFVRFFSLIPRTLIVWSCPSFCAIFLCLHPSHCLLYVFSYFFLHFQLEIPLAYPFFSVWSMTFDVWKTREKKTETELKRIDLLCVWLYASKEYVQFLKGSLSRSLGRSYIFWVLLLLCVISYCFPRSFPPLARSIFILHYEFGWMHLISRADVARTTISNNRNHPKLLSIVGRKSANNRKKKTTNRQRRRRKTQIE